MTKKMKKYPKFILCLYAGIWVFSFSANVAFAIHQEFEAIKELQAMEKSDPLEVIDMPIVEYTAEGMRNPFQGYIEQTDVINVGSTSEEEVSLPAFEVQGVVWGGDVPQAIINNKIVKTGDVLSDAKILEISKQGITILYHDRRYNIMSPSAIAMGSLEQTLKAIDENRTLRGGQNE